MAFPLWVIFGIILTFIQPSLFTWFSGNFITYGLGIIMLGMGLTISFDDFKNVLKVPKWVITGLVLHFTVMPFLGWFMGYLFHLPTFLQLD